MPVFEDFIFGIVQGRLIQPTEGLLQWFPQEYWESEFFIASALGYNYIELISERQHNKQNPLWSDQGIEKIIALAKRNVLTLHVICDDYIIDHSLINDKTSLEQIRTLISRASLLHIEKLIIPLFEESELRENNFDDYKNILYELADVASSKKILICLETILEGKDLLSFLEYLNHPNVKCVFDTGNRIALGHDIYSDILILGDKIQHVHIKDKNDRNENVLLGTGKVNFHEVLKSLIRIEYQGPYTFETHRGNNPMRTAKYNKSFIEFFLNEAYSDEN